jgi:hypothetical protein
LFSALHELTPCVVEFVVVLPMLLELVTLVELLELTAFDTLVEPFVLIC